MNFIVTHSPDNGIDKFEEISYLLKKQREGKLQSLADFLSVADERSYSKPGIAVHGETTIKYLQKVRKLIDVSDCYKVLVEKGGRAERGRGGGRGRRRGRRQLGPVRVRAGRAG